MFKEKISVIRGFLFVDEQGKSMKLKDLEPFVLARIARVQNYFPDLIRKAVDVHEEYCLSIPFRGGCNSET